MFEPILHPTALQPSLPLDLKEQDHDRNRMPNDPASREVRLKEETLFPTLDLGGLPIAVTNMADAAHKLCVVATDSSRESGVSVHLVNAYTIALANSDEAYLDVFSASSANLPDGKPLCWLSRIAGAAVHQVRGPSLFGAVLNEGRSHGLKHFLLGATPEVLRSLREEIERRYPGVSIVGELSPPFRESTPVEVLAQDDAIAASGAHVVWVGLGTPKQDFEVQRMAKRLPIVSIAIGAAFDFVAGTKKEAPGWLSRLGLEWLFRLASEPKRLWRRYLIGNFHFLYAVLVAHNSTFDARWGRLPWVRGNK